MKYIKIENTILLEKDYLQGIIDGTVDRNKTVKVADKIEELCDEFVVVRKDGETEIMDDSDVDFHIREGFYPTEDTEETYYGAIWTDKGLIYVAKMNDKGELELL